MKSKPKNKQKFVLGDRVKLRAQDRFHAMTRGIVVPYHGRHDPENPRVRWDSGWDVSSKAEALIKDGAQTGPKRWA